MENGKKLKSSNILKHGAKLRAKKIDFNDPEVKRMLKTVREEQKKCLERKNVDWGKLDRLYVNI